MTIQDVYNYLDSRAPFATCEEWDNVGLLVGDPRQTVSGILVTLDVTDGAIDAAVAAGANLIVSHHPVIFSALKTLGGDSIPYRLAAAGIAVISAHTNLDRADGGVNDTLAALLGLEDIHPSADGLCRIGTLSQETTPAAFAKTVADVLSTAVRLNGGCTIRTVAVCGGSGGDFIDALTPYADAFVTGEVRHHEWLAARGIAVIEAGHYATEVPVVDTLCRWLTEAYGIAVTPYYDGEPYTTIF